jgi:hypothetical protein
VLKPVAVDVDKPGLGPSIKADVEDEPTSIG